MGRLGTRDLLIAIAPVQVSGHTLVLINQIDVTELRRAEAGLRINEERLELAREGANLGIWDWDIVHDTCPGACTNGNCTAWSLGRMDQPRNCGGMLCTRPTWRACKRNSSRP